ncbi:MAG: hypothetical protein DI562_20555 [Stenotrophomonas acidaminiphila]|nr:MAG: hypothetical protein DI562_20555 [Stenotrophomonas acidaminiphila]
MVQHAHVRGDARLRAGGRCARRARRRRGWRRACVAHRGRRVLVPARTAGRADAPRQGAPAAVRRLDGGVHPGTGVRHPLRSSPACGHPSLDHAGDVQAGLLEMEVHAPFRTLAAGEAMQAQERWTLLAYDGPETQEAQVAFLCERLALCVAPD